MYVGQAIVRRADERFLRGRGNYVDDISLSEPIAHAAFARSPHAHAKVVRIETGAARAMPGVLAVLTGEDWLGAGAILSALGGGILGRGDPCRGGLSGNTQASR